MIFQIQLTQACALEWLTGLVLLEALLRKDFPDYFPDTNCVENELRMVQYDPRFAKHQLQKNVSYHSHKL